MPATSVCLLSMPSRIVTVGRMFRKRSRISVEEFARLEPSPARARSSGELVNTLPVPASEMPPRMPTASDAPKIWS